MSEEKSYFQDEHDLDVNDETYKPINGIAILSIILAVFSLMSVTIPLMVILNAVAACTAIIAIAQINKQPRFIGMKLAQFALFLAVVGGVVSLGYFLGRTAYLNSYARKHSSTLLEYILDNRYGEAYQFSISPDMRLPEGTDLVAYYGHSRIKGPGHLPPMAQIKIWQNDPPLSVVEADQRQGKFRFMGYEHIDPQDHIWYPVGCIYRYEPASPELEASTFVAVMYRREYEGDLGTTWRFRNFVILEGPRPKEGIQRIGPPTKSEDESEETTDETADGE